MSKPTTSKTSIETMPDEEQLGMNPEDRKALGAKTDEEIAADVASDPDAAPIVAGSRSPKARRISLAKHVRQKLAMSRERFAESYGIPLQTLEAWEQHKATPTPVEEAYLRLIEREPEIAAASPLPAK